MATCNSARKRAKPMPASPTMDICWKFGPELARSSIGAMNSTALSSGNPFMSVASGCAKHPTRLGSRMAREFGLQAECTGVEGQPLTLRLAVSEEPLRHEFWTMVAVLGVGLPITVLLIGFTGYIVAGRALLPVDSMA